MQAAARHLLGELDFRSFQAAGCQARTTFREMRFVEVYRPGAFIVIHVCANAFLQQMVRIISGTLLEIGKGKRHPDSMREILLAQDRKAAGPTAPPDGLYLVGVEYPASSHLPDDPVPPPPLSSLFSMGV